MIKIHSVLSHTRLVTFNSTLFKWSHKYKDLRATAVRTGHDSNSFLPDSAVDLHQRLSLWAAKRAPEVK